MINTCSRETGCTYAKQFIGATTAHFPFGLALLQGHKSFLHVIRHASSQPWIYIRSTHHAEDPAKRQAFGSLQPPDNREENGVRRKGVVIRTSEKVRGQMAHFQPVVPVTWSDLGPEPWPEPSL